MASSGPERSDRQTSARNGPGTPDANEHRSDDERHHRRDDDPGRRLARAAAGLTYMSEGDFPFEPVALEPIAPPASHDARDLDLEPERLLALLGEPGGSRVEMRTLDEFLARHIERSDPLDPVARDNRARYEALRAALRAELAGVRVFRVGEGRVRCYVLGTTADGRIAGLATVALET